MKLLMKFIIIFNFFSSISFSHELYISQNISNQNKYQLNNLIDEKFNEFKTIDSILLPSDRSNKNKLNGLNSVEINEAKNFFYNIFLSILDNNTNTFLDNLANEIFLRSSEEDEIVKKKEIISLNDYRYFYSVIFSEEVNNTNLSSEILIVKSLRSYLIDLLLKKSNIDIKFYIGSFRHSFTNYLVNFDRVYISSIKIKKDKNDRYLYQIGITKINNIWKIVYFAHLIL